VPVVPGGHPSPARGPPAMLDMCVKSPVSVAGRECGDCSLCCKLLNIDSSVSLDIAKPAGQWCKYCKPGKGGCSIYESRPEICKSWLCGWRIFPDMPDRWNPRNCKMVLNLSVNEQTTKCATIAVDKDARNKWREEPYWSDIKLFAKNFYATARVALQIRIAGEDNVSWMIDFSGTLPPLELPKTHFFTTICDLPIMKIHQDLIGDWIEASEYIMQPYKDLATRVQDFPANERSNFIGSVLNTVMGIVLHRIDEKGFKINPNREIVRK
jgi:hypothetical protein